ncbi:switch-associated protein 70 isoform X1 [Octopus bimaculoides]|uniref:switch-associated protein 70 isoform X1 n=1 Tax=Octopus bimaculoides TaxID=37653 RepID=UPI0022E8CBF5|nr:switch-associated protein 70 isoform X1 [Octopus bimaculoides]
MQELKMEELEKAVWHAFIFLADKQSGLTQKSKLKVLTNNLGNELGFLKSEEKLDKCSSTELNFEEYLKLLKSEVFTDSHLSFTPKAESIKEICWILCKNKVWEFPDQPKLKSSDAFTLWKLFNFLSEREENGQYMLPLSVDRAEIEHLFDRFGHVTGQQPDQKSMEGALNKETERFPFPKLLSLFQNQYLNRLVDNEISIGLNEIYDELIKDVMKKGMMSKRGTRVATWKERFFVLKPACLLYYTGPDQKEMKGSIDINNSCAVVPTQEKTCRFIIRTKIKDYELNVSDMKSKNEWITVLQKAIDNDDKDIHYHRDELIKRCQNRWTKKQQLAEEREQQKIRQELIEMKSRELEEEKQARAEAEARLQLETALREADKDHMKELEQLLEEERQAKRDEELVRAAQARVLQEEFEKREELERLKAMQEQLLAEEQSKREGIEEERNKQAQLLAAAKLQLEELQRERSVADEQLQSAKEKIKQVETERSKMEQKLKFTVKPIGLARLVQPKCPTFITHRGYGAFPHYDLQKNHKNKCLNNSTENQEDLTDDDGGRSSN